MTFQVSGSRHLSTAVRILLGTPSLRPGVLFLPLGPWGTPPPCLCPPTVPSPWTPAVAPGPQCARARQGHGWPELHTDVGPRQGAPAFPPTSSVPCWVSTGVPG